MIKRKPSCNFHIFLTLILLQDIDVGLLLKLQNRVKDLEKEKAEMQKEIDTSEEQEQKPTSSSDVITDSAFNALKVS